MKDGSNCPFCSKQIQIQHESKTAFAIFDKYPVTNFHSLIIPKRHVKSYFELTDIEKSDCLDLVSKVRQFLCETDEKITGFNVGINDGDDAGQTIEHCHIHLIPRRKNDVENPLGGIRNIFPKKGYYETLVPTP